jgi:hypothetical protein
MHTIIPVNVFFSLSILLVCSNCFKFLADLKSKGCFDGATSRLGALEEAADAGFGILESIADQNISETSDIFEFLKCRVFLISERNSCCTPLTSCRSLPYYSI